ncbi:hypothetical protein EXIGLDRAFT_746211 [Exidia glandulosa HHB12029]|uniref:Uncharacterized protein n=1 Tax=Exidia glandulosa HHB12029 TaxID=1314781 RepID=A0A165MGJ8_EXIGL|nr:hypothetical protein EXIGLDRAFT_746211 [Exidia glandulosa HHB12029]
MPSALRRSPLVVAAVWESEVLPIVKLYWPMPVDNTLPELEKIDHKAYITVYSAVFETATVSPRELPPTLGPTSLISFHFDALILEWTRAVCLYVGTDIHRYLRTWHSFQSRVKYTWHLFDYMDRCSLPLNGKALAETACLPLETEMSESEEE